MTRKKKTEAEEIVIAYKGFDKNLQCRGYQFEIGGTYGHEGKVEACASGFHACEYPLDVLGYYAPAGSRFALIEQSGDIFAAVQAVRARYPVEVFPADGASVDCRSAAMARVVCDAVTKELRALLDEGEES
ncbi:hypothetical protein D9M69_414170 [compost metagenome]